MHFVISHEEAILKLFLSLIVGLIIGIEREIKKKPLGLKTTIIISVSSCLLTLVSIESAYTFAEAYKRPMDPLRLAAQIVSGVGFLGAGAILRRSNDVISGLTTAAIVWGAAGLGITIGAGFYIEALTATILMMLSIDLLAPLLKKFGPKTLRQKEMKAKIFVDDQTNIQDVLYELRKVNLNIKYVRIRDQKDDPARKVELALMTAESLYTSEVYERIKKIEGVLAVEIESAG